MESNFLTYYLFHTFLQSITFYNFRKLFDVLILVVIKLHS